MATNYNWDLPTVGGSVDTWGTELNTAINGAGASTGAGNSIDDDLKTVEDQADLGVSDAAAAQATADAALPKAGGVMTGRTDELTGAAKVTSHATATGALALDLALSNIFKLNLTGNLQPTASNVPGTSNYVDVLVLDITINAYDVTDWSGLGTIEWAGGSAPTLNAHDMIMLLTFDGGINWQGSVLQKNLS